MNSVFINYVKKNILLIIFFVVPLPVLFWLPFGRSLMHGPVYPWPENISTMFGIVNYYLYAWLPAGFGFPTTELSGSLFNYITAVFSKIGGSPHIGQPLFFYFGFVGILSGIFFLARALKFSKLASLIAGVFYLLSPAIFTGTPMEVVNMKLIPFHIMTPVLLALFIRALASGSFKKEWFVFGITCYLATAGYGSLQYFALHFMILSVYSVFFIFSKYHRKISIKKGLIRICLLFGIMFLINYFWLSPILFNLQDSYNLRAEPGFSAEHDSNMVKGTSAKIINAIRMLPYPAQVESVQWMSYYYTPLLTVVIFTFLALSVWTLIDKNTRRFAIFPFFWLIVAVFFVKGVEKPFAFFGNYLFFSQPYIMRLFRNVTYFELLIVPALSLLVGLSIGNLIKKTSSKYAVRIIVILIISVFILWGWPFISGIALNQDDELKPYQYNIVPKYYNETAEFLKNKKGNFRINSVPAFTTQGVFVAYKWDSIYSGTQPLGLHSEKSFYRPFYPQLIGKADSIMNGVLHPQESIISQETWNFLLGTGNVRYVTLHHDVAWDLLYRMNPEGLSVSSEDDINKFISKSNALKKVETFGSIDIYRIKDENYLPHFYVPKEVSFVKNSQDFLSRINNYSNKQVRLATYSQDQNSQQLAELSSLKSENYKESFPVLEFKKINPAKYRIRVHGANGSFPLVFSEAFHSGWRAFVLRGIGRDASVNRQNIVKSEKLASYKILDGNEADQVGADELKDYINKGWVTDLGDGKEKTINHISWDADDIKNSYSEKYNIDFISKNFQGTIQNENMPMGSIFETWFPARYNAIELPEKNHLIANGYANSWVIDIDEICGISSAKSSCIKNTDGSYDLELLIEYKPQHQFYVGMFISGTALLFCLAFTGISWYKEKSNKLWKKTYEGKNN